MNQKNVLNRENGAQKQGFYEFLPKSLKIIGTPRGKTKKMPKIQKSQKVKKIPKTTKQKAENNLKKLKHLK